MADVQGKVQHSPDLLANGSEAVMLDLIKIKNPDEVDQKDGRDDGANVGTGGGGGIL